jgi:hypothetical protein
MAKRDDDEPTPEEARALMHKLLHEAGAAVSHEQAAAEAEAAARAEGDAVDRRKDAKPMLGTAPRPNAPAAPTVGRGQRKKP